MLETTMRHIGMVLSKSGSKKGMRDPVVIQGLFEGQPVMIESADNSTTGRHGSGKTNFRYRLLFSGQSSEQIVPTDTKVTCFNAWLAHSPEVSKREGVVVSTSPIAVKDVTSLQQEEVRDLWQCFRASKGDTVPYYIWNSPKNKKEIAFYSCR